MRSFLPLLVAFPLCAVSAFGWGCEGHQMVALIARSHLTPVASAAVDKLLADNPPNPAVDRFCKDNLGDLMAMAATWADDAKKIEKTSLWHYVDIPLAVRKSEAKSGGIEPFCPPIGPALDDKNRPGCVTDALEYELAILRNPAQPAASRATALRYIIHFTGDIHQPLHGSDNNDSGGNCTELKFFLEEKPVNLHSVWDYKLIERQLTANNMTQPAYANALDQKFAGRWQDWGAADADVIGWAWESRRLAEAVTYGKLPVAIPVENPEPAIACAVEKEKVAGLHIAVGAEYFTASIPVIEERLAQAGYRLAALLNHSF